MFMSANKPAFIPPDIWDLKRVKQTPELRKSKEDIKSLRGVMNSLEWHI